MIWVYYFEIIQKKRKIHIIKKVKKTINKIIVINIKYVYYMVNILDEDEKEEELWLLLWSKCLSFQVDYKKITKINNIINKV